MAKSASLTERKIESFVGGRSFELGREYVAEGAVSRMRRDGRAVEACVQGTAARPYKVEVQFDEAGKIRSAGCSCPVGSGACKHVAAVLIAYCRTPDAFVEVGEVDEKLQKLDKGRLVKLVKQIFRQHPELEVLLDTLPEGKRPLKPDAFRKQADGFFDNAEDEWGYTSEVASQLRGLLKTGDDFLEARQAENAAAVWQGVLQSVMAHDYAFGDDEPGDLFCVIQDCVVGLGKCLKVMTEPAARLEVFHRLVDVVMLDGERGGVGLSDDVWDLLEDQTTPAIRQELAERVRRAIPDSSGWARDSLETLLETLEE